MHLGGRAERAGTQRGAEQLADQGAVRGVQGADGGRADARLGGGNAAPGPAGLGGDPQVARVAALEFGDDRRAGGEPAGEDVHGRLGQRDGLTVDVGARLVPVQVQRADVEVRELGHAAAAVGDERGDRGGAQRGHRVGVDGPLDGQVVQQRLGIARSELVAARGRLAVQPRRLAEELREGVDRVDPYPHRVRVRGRLRAPAAVAGPGLARGRVGQPRGRPVAVHQVTRGQRRAARAVASRSARCRIVRRGGLLRVAQVLVQVRLADPAGRRGQVTVGEVPQEGVDGIACRSARVWSWHAREPTPRPR